MYFVSILLLLLVKAKAIVTEYQFVDVSQEQGTILPMNPNWFGIAMKSDGSKVAAIVGNGDIYQSSNAGMTWVDASTRTGSGLPSDQAWLSIAMSSDGTVLAAVINGGDIYISNSSGLTWVDASNRTGSGLPASSTNTAWYSITMSNNGTVLAAVVIQRQTKTDKMKLNKITLKMKSTREQQNRLVTLLNKV